jgi:hypothetical protein
VRLIGAGTSRGIDGLGTGRGGGSSGSIGLSPDGGSVRDNLVFGSSWLSSSRSLVMVCLISPMVRGRSARAGAVGITLTV